MGSRWRAPAFSAVFWVLSVVPALAQTGPMPNSVVELHFTPTDYAQIALWVERADGEFLTTVRLTEATAYRGIGNRPGASQMNSGFRWPYGRREGALPIWATRRLNQPGAQPFKRVIFQDRDSEGLASRTSNDQSKDDYFCLSFDRSTTTKDALDAVSCATVFNSDKGRFITEQDVANRYAEPFEDLVTHEGRMQPLTLLSLYPPRRDAEYCGELCYDHPDVALYRRHAREVMPNIDAVTMATPVGDMPQQVLLQVPKDWAPGEYVAYLEINVEGDYNEVHNDQSHPTPRTPEHTWDSWAMTYGYAYRGQPSVVYSVPFVLGEMAELEFATATPDGISSWRTTEAGYGELDPMQGMTDDPLHAPGSGVDRLLIDPINGSRFRVVVRSPFDCMHNDPPSAVDELEISAYGDELHAHERAHLRFKASGDDDGVHRYEVRFSTEPIVDEETFLSGEPAKMPEVEAEELVIPVTAQEGEVVNVDFGGLRAESHYYVGIRAQDTCASTGEIRVAEFDTPARTFATVTPCFVATAAYGTPLSAEIGALRRFRDRYLLNHSVGRVLVDAYYALGPELARVVRQDEQWRAAARWVLSPFVAFSRALLD